MPAVTSKAVNAPLLKIRKVADYQFGRGVGEKFFPDNVTIVSSSRTRKIRYIYLNGKLLATLKPSEGLFSLTVDGAERAMKTAGLKKLWVQVQEDAAAFVEKGSDVFARHVVNADEEIRPREEVIVLDERKKVLAVGRALLSGKEMRDFKKGVAVKVRKGNLEKVKKEKEAIRCIEDAWIAKDRPPRSPKNDAAHGLEHEPPGC